MLSGCGILLTGAHRARGAQIHAEIVMLMKTFQNADTKPPYYRDILFTCEYISSAALMTLELLS